MIKIIADNFVKKECINEFLAIAEKLIEATREEEGCQSYDLYADLNDASHLTFIEEWADKNAIEKHNNSTHFKTYVPELAKYCEKPGTCYLYSALEL